MKKNDVQWNSCRATLLNLQAYLPAKILCKCLKPKDSTRFFLDGYGKLLKELSVTRFLKTI